MLLEAFISWHNWFLHIVVMVPALQVVKIISLQVWMGLHQVVGGRSRFQ